MTVKPDHNATVKFLTDVRPAGPWLLTAINPEPPKATDTRSFMPSEEAALREWLQKHHDSGWGLYWSTNPAVNDKLAKKASKKEIKAVEYLHVDCDPRVGEDFAAERERIFETLLGGERPAIVPLPTFVVDSGGGYQAFWQLDEPIPTGGDEALAVEAERYTRKLENKLTATTATTSRVSYAAAGTVNFPNKKKWTTAGQPALAQVVQWGGAVYKPSQFHQAHALGAPAAGPSPVIIGAKAERLADINELDEYDVDDRIKVICVQGKHLDETKEGDNSRSAWVYDAGVQLHLAVRCQRG